MHKFRWLNALITTGLKQYRFYGQKRHIPTKAERQAVINIKKALEYYDAVYPPVFGSKKWTKMKNALMKEAKYAALINNFTDNENIISEFEELGAYDVGALYTKKAKEFKENYPDLFLQDSNQQIDSKQSKAERPSLIELTADEKAEAANKDDIDRYPEEYKKRALTQEFDSNASRLIKASQVGNNLGSLTFDHIPPTKLKGCEEWIEETDVFRGVGDASEDIGVKRIMEKEPIVWPKNLKVYSFIKGETLSEFTSPRPSTIVQAYTHYLLNGSSILPVLALDLQRGDTVLDLCASPGGNSLTLLQTCLPSLLVCNETRLSGLNKIDRVFAQYIPKSLSSVWDTIDISQNSGHQVVNPDFFDRVLIDAPCLNDRLSLQESDDSIFKTNKTKERLGLPELQANLIVSALKYTKPGGCVVYSTCTLSPLQNDGAVHLALTRIWRETKIDCTVVNLLPTLKNLNFCYSVGHDLKLRYGHIILPFVDNNFGPLYICKIIRDR